MAAVYYEKEGVILDRTSFTEDGKGDSLWRTAITALVKRDYRLLINVADLLLWRRRWPEALDNPTGIEHRKAEGFGSMTRDPYTMFYVAAYLMNREQLIRDIVPPWYIRIPEFCAWRRFMITRHPRHLRRWERMKAISMLWADRLPAYALHLNCWMAWVAGSEKVMAMLRPHIPHWNYLLKQLTLHPLRYLDESFIQEYIPRTGFIWQEAAWDPDRKYLSSEDHILLDREALLYVYNKNKAQ